MNLKAHFSVAAMWAVVLTSCQTTDIEPPTLCTPEGTPSSVIANEIEALAGTDLVLVERVCDNQELSEVRWDIHNAADHAHEAGEAEEGFVLHSGMEWEVLETVSVSGTESDISFTLSLPLSARGVWDVVFSMVDAEGNVAEDRVTQMHLENDHLPEFELESVDGVNPSSWQGEPTWNAGGTVAIQGSCFDSDGLAAVSLELIEEATELVLWERSWTFLGENTMFFDELVEVPADTPAGECHFEMKASDSLGNQMETGFHVEVE